ncbi:C4-dicarboxylate TRAP transporter substrate-binding protein [Yaniella flava]|uniref:C4-dicarboxylate TRAP transporter substrate-binding protein n=1 Tax=Yaniella flava TaxID=287930 RepID=A0ABN2UC65_9MICC
MKKSLTPRLGKLAAVAAAGALALTACGDGVVDQGGGSGETFEFTQANGALDGTPHAAVSEAYMDAVEEASDGQITFERTSFEATCAMDEVADCVSDGRADIGVTVTDYTPHLLPTLSVMSISFLNNDIQASVEALYDVHNNYEPASQELENANLEYIGAWPVGALLLGSDEPIESLEAVNGMSARAAGPVTQRTLEAAGINVNAITAAETYESLQRGVIDSVASSLDFAVNYNITEQLPYWVDPGLGQYTAYGMWWNKDAYDSLTPELQETVDGVTQEFNQGEIIATSNGALEEVCQGMLDSPDVENFSSWPEEETQAWEDLAGDEAQAAWLEIMEDYNFTDAEAYLDEYVAAYESHESEENPVDAGIACADTWQEQNS